MSDFCTGPQGRHSDQKLTWLDTQTFMQVEHLQKVKAGSEAFDKKNCLYPSPCPPTSHLPKKKLRSDHLVVGGQARNSMSLLKGRFQKLRSDHPVVGAQGGRWRGVQAKKNCRRLLIWSETAFFYLVEYF